MLDIRILFLTFYGLLKPTGVIPGQDVDEIDDLGLSPDRNLKTRTTEER